MPSGAAPRTAVLLVAAAGWLLAPVEVAGQGTEGPADVVVDTRFEYYEVDGETLSDVVGRLNGLRLQGPGGPLSQGLTRYNILPEYVAVPGGGACRISDLDVQVRVVITLPRWTGVDDRSPEEQEGWQKIDDAIRGHELEHKALVVEAAERLAETMRSLETRGCGILDQVVESTLSVAGGRLREAHVELDRTTPPRLTLGGTEGRRP